MSFISLQRLAALILLAWAALALQGCASSSKEDFSGRAAEKLYREAKDDIESGSFDRAIKALERVEGLGAGSLLSQQAQLDLAYAYWRTNERAQALSTIDRFVKLNPSSPALDYAIYLRGVINFNDDLGLLGGLFGQDLSERDQRAARDSFNAFKQLVDQFPESKYTPDAQARMRFIVNSLANYEVHVARYYYRRGAYVAAANRAQQAIAEFQQAPATEEALAILVRSYDKLQLTQLRDASERVLRTNYPTSRFLGGAEPGASARSWWKLW